MNGKDGFAEALAAKLAVILPDEESQAAAQALLDRHRIKLRYICTVPARMGVRVAKLAAVDDELLDALDALNPHEEHAEGEQLKEKASVLHTENKTATKPRKKKQPD